MPRRRAFPPSTAQQPLHAPSLTIMIPRLGHPPPSYCKHDQEHEHEHEHEHDVHSTPTSDWSHARYQVYPAHAVHHYYTLWRREAAEDSEETPKQPLSIVIHHPPLSTTTHDDHTIATYLTPSHMTTSTSSSRLCPMPFITTIYGIIINYINSLLSSVLVH